MFNKVFGKKPNEPDPEPMLEHDQIWPTLPTRQRFRRTRSAASESLYADYVSDDWGDAPTVFHDRHGEEINPRSPTYSDDLEDWQRPTNTGQTLFRNVSARVRSLSVSRPNWSRAPPSAPTYGWAQRVEQAGGPDEKQKRRDEERSRRPVAIPVPNPAPGPIDVRGDNDGVVEASALQPPALVRRKSSTRAGPGSEKGARTALGHRSTTSSPTIIHQPRPTQTPGAGPSKSKGAEPGGRRHLSRVEKIAAVLQHVASLPWMADTPVQTYYPPTDDAKVADSKNVPAEPFHTYSVPPSVPKRYRPPPVPLQAGWYQPKPPKSKKPKKPKADMPKKTRTNLGGVGNDAALDDFEDELFEYPDYDEYMNRAYTGDTPTLQSDAYTDESEPLYEHYYPRMIEGAPGEVPVDPIRPAYFPGPIKSTGMTTRVEERQPARAPLQIMPPPGVMGPGYGEMGPGHGEMGSGYGYEYDDSEYEEESESSRGPIPSPLTTSNARSPLWVTTDGLPPPLVIPTPTSRTAPIPQPGQPYSRHYKAAAPNTEGPPLPGGYGPLPQVRGASAQGWGLRGGSAQGWGTRGGSAQGWGPTVHARGGSAQSWGALPGRGLSAQGWGPPGREPSAQGWGPPAREPGAPPREASAQGWGPPPRKASSQGWGPPTREPFAQEWGSPSESEGQESEEWGPPLWGPTPDRTPRAHEFPVPPTGLPRGYGRSPQAGYGPSPQTGWGPSPQTGWGQSPQAGWGPSPQAGWGPSPQAGWGLSPQTPLGPAAYGPSPQIAYGPSPQTGYGPSPQQYASYPYGYYPQPIWDPYGVAPRGKNFHITDSPPHRGDSPPPVPSPIATSIARSPSSRRRSGA
ncbi:hypothetical protein FRC10_008566 [Ceratobasidium sp. 414]|nr:hypothetical protein FRC10_008566 [Ceratobasidium sp. 414]